MSIDQVPGFAHGLAWMVSALSPRLDGLGAEHPQAGLLHRWL
ncbi:hypothetical protein SynPROSU1_02010 [Synechococcus sp. PROS-U-1]|nr:hypothetical protein SynPROSU1_02010 [Synechococcus sp. PROS-U-1]